MKLKKAVVPKHGCFFAFKLYFTESRMTARRSLRRSSPSRSPSSIRYDLLVGSTEISPAGTASTVFAARSKSKSTREIRRDWVSDEVVRERFEVMLPRTESPKSPTGRENRPAEGSVYDISIWSSISFAGGPPPPTPLPARTSVVSAKASIRIGEQVYDNLMIVPLSASQSKA